MIYYININTDTTYLYKIDNNIIHKIADTTGKYVIPTCLYFDSNSDNILYGNECLFKMFKHGWVSSFLSLLNIKYSEMNIHENIELFFNNQNISIYNNNDTCHIITSYNNQEHIFSIEELLYHFLNYLINIISLQDKEEEIYYNIIIPNTFTENESTLLTKYYKNIFKKLNLNNSNIIIENININNNVFVNISDYNLIIKTNNEIIKKYSYGLDIIKEKLYNIIINKLKTNVILKTNIIFHIKKYINLNFEQILKTIKTNTFNCILEIDDEIYNIKITKINIYDSILELTNKIIENIDINIDSNQKIEIISYDSLFENLLILTDKIHKYRYKIYKYIYSKNDIESKIINEKSIKKLPISVGIATDDGFMCKFINKNSIIPYKKTKIFLYKNTEDDKSNTELKLGIYKGNKLYANQNIHLKEIILNFDEKYKDNELKLKITFYSDSSEYINIIIENTNNNKIYKFNNINLNTGEYFSDSDDEFQCIELDNNKLNK
jgi:hypothetical protein